MPQQAGQEAVGVHELGTGRVGSRHRRTENTLMPPMPPRLRAPSDRCGNAAGFGLLTGVCRYQAGRIIVRIALQPLWRQRQFLPH